MMLALGGSKMLRSYILFGNKTYSEGKGWVGKGTVKMELFV